MTPEQRKNARARLDLFLTASDGGFPVSRAELAGYLKDALDQLDDDEGLMGDAIATLAVDSCDCPDCTTPPCIVIRALRARLGEVPAQGEEAKDELANSR